MSSCAASYGPAQLAHSMHALGSVARATGCSCTAPPERHPEPTQQSAPRRGSHAGGALPQSQRPLPWEAVDHSQRAKHALQGRNAAGVQGCGARVGWQGGVQRLVHKPAAAAVRRAAGEGGRHTA